MNNSEKGLNGIQDNDHDEIYSNADMLNQELMISEKLIDNDASFFATFVDGSSFRNMIEYIRLNNTKGVFRFGDKKIKYEQEDSTGKVLIIVEIKTYELTDYNFRSRCDEIPIGINLAKLRDITRVIGKKDHMDLYRLSGEPDILYIRVKSQTEKGSGDQSNLYPVYLIENNYETYGVPQYARGRKDPNCTIYQSDFSKFFKSIAVIKCNHVILHCFEYGIVVKGITNFSTVGAVKEFGRCNQNTGTQNLKSVVGAYNITKSDKPKPRLNITELGEVEKYKISLDVAKTLNKLNGLSPNGTIKIYAEKGLPLKMVCNIGSFGKMTIYIKKPKENI